MQEYAVWWIKRDIRIQDNLALDAALQSGLPVIPLFVFEPSLLFAEESSAIHAYAQFTALQGLSLNVAKRGSKVLILHCECEEAFRLLLERAKVVSVYSQQETGLESTYSRDRRMAEWFTSNGIYWHDISQGGVVRAVNGHEERERMKKNFYQQKTLQPPERLLSLPKGFDSMPTLVREFNQFGFEPGKHAVQRVAENEAHSALRSFLLYRGEGYRYGISSPVTAFQTGSRLSTHLAWGTISPRTVFEILEQERQSPSNFLSREKDLSAFASRVHWRDHFMQRLELEPEMEFKPLNRLFANLPYRDDPRVLNRWITGETGFPLVDASMRCLSKTGFLNFRMRAMITSFATHALRLDWRVINKPLARLMYDYEPGIHVSQIQMQAGVTGMNAMRVYSPAKQLVEQDPDLVFTRQWVPELKDIDAQSIRAAGNTAIPGYIEPLVDFTVETKIMKDALYEIKKSPENEIVSHQVWQRSGSRRQFRKRPSSR